MPTFFLTECPGLQTSIQASDTVGNTTTASIFGSSYTWGSSAFSVVGRRGRLEAKGLFSTDSGGHDLTVEVLVGTTSMLSTGAVTPTLAGGTSRGWALVADWRCTTVGTAGALEAQGYTILGTSTLASDVAFMTNTSTIGIDLTQQLPVSVRVTWGTASANNAIQMRLMGQEIMGTS